MSKHKRIFIVGHSGAGKGVFAQALAKALDWKFIDADFGMAPSIGRMLPDVIGDEGEKKFYNCLSDILNNQLQQENIVVTTDDGIVCNDKNLEMLSSEFTVYLKVSPDVQLSRISHNRPLLPVDDYVAFLKKLREERDSLYEKVSSFSLSSDDGDINEHVQKVINELNQ